MNKPNKLIFNFKDNTNENQYNESTKMEKVWYGEQVDGQVLNMETYYYMCKEFAAAMGFSEKTINEWFGED